MPGVIAMGVSLPSKDRWIGVWYGEVMSRVNIGGVVGKSSTMIAGMSTRTMSHRPDAVRRVKALTRSAHRFHASLLTLGEVPPAVQNHEQQRLDAIEVDEVCDKLVRFSPYDEVLQPVPEDL